MLPTLEPGWFVLVDPGSEPEDGEVVVSRHPENPELLIIKRCRQIDDGRYWLSSDNSVEGSDSTVFGSIERDLIVGPVTLVLDSLRPLQARKG